jgi:hypothetical protein
MTFYRSSMPPKQKLRWLIALALCFGSSLVNANSQRDPTVPPPFSGAALAELASSELASSELVETSIGIESGDRTIIVRNGLPYLVIDNLFYTEGDTIGSVQIVRITETEIWLSEAGILRKSSMFPSIQRRTVEPLAADPHCVYSHSTSSFENTLCINIEP